MTLPDFLKFEPFNRLRRLMNAPLPAKFASGYVINHLTHDDLDRALEDIEGVTVDDITDVHVLPDGTLAYRERRVLLYIRDKRAFREHDPREKLPKFHIANCRMLEEMRENGRFERYVISTRINGEFKMDFIYEFGAREEIHELKVCKLCLVHLEYKGYSNHRSDKRIYDTFALHEYFVEYPKNQVITLPLHTDDTAPLNEYGGGFPKASQRYRAKIEWRCQKCGIDLSHPSHHKYLHTHHLNGQKYDDRTENYKALCVHCHAQEPMHAHLKNSPDWRQFMRIYSRLRLSVPQERHTPSR
jgi:hypothetical protein